SSPCDTGIGIPADQQDRLFKSFSQADPATSTRFGGTGLGLAISKELVGLMDGEIGLHSEVGRGSTFWFTLPLTVLDAATRQPHRYAMDPRNLRVLVVDDNPASC